MKRIIIFCVFSLFFVGNPVFGETFYFTGTSNGSVADYCLIGMPKVENSDSALNTCYWCESGGDRGGYCMNQYPSCYGGRDAIVSVGQVFQDSVTAELWTCTNSGWSTNHTPETCYSGSGCKDGCYWDSGPYTCLSCPDADFISPSAPIVKAYTEKPGERSNITDCFVRPGRGFRDITGMFDLEGNCHYSE